MGARPPKKLATSAARRFALSTPQLLEAAQRVFLRDGFHGASLDAIAEEAGYTTGAVYSNFRGKDDLFLAVREAEARRPELRRQVAEQHERLLDTVGGLLEEWTVRWDVEFKLPAREVVRGVYAISRGMGWRRCWPTSREPPAPSSSRRCSWPTRWA
jgi:AcrR family transcriptional regulator